MQKRKRIEESKSNKELNMDRMDKYISILGGLTFSIDPLINEYIQENLTVLGQCYLLQMINPFLFLNHPIQQIGYMGNACELYTSTVTGNLYTSTYTTSGTAASYGYIYSVMQYAPFSNTASIYGMSASSQTRTTSSTHTGVTSATASSTLATTDLGTLSRRYRIVAHAIRIKNVSGRDLMGGTCIALRTPFNGVGTGLAFEDCTNYTYTKIEDFDSDWTTVFWTPKDEFDFSYYSSATAIASEAALQIHFKGPSTTSSSVAAYEVATIFEVNGYNEKNIMAYARSMSDFFKVMELLQYRCHYKGGHTNYEYTVMT